MVLKILAIHPGALGDVLQAVPAIVALRGFGGGANLAFSGQPRLAEFFCASGLVDKAISFDGLGLNTLFSRDGPSAETRARLQRFDRVISWFGSREGAFVETLRSVVADVLVALPVPDTGPPPTVWEHLVGTLAPWGVVPTTAPRPIGVRETWRAEARLILRKLGWDGGRPLLVVHARAGGPAKLWPAENFARAINTVVRETGCQVLVHQGPADREAVAGLVRHLDRPALMLAEPSLPLLAAVLASADAYLGGDSGVSHLAAAVGARAIILYPPATRERWAPWSPTAVSLTVSADSEDVEPVARATVEAVRRKEGVVSHD